MAITITDLKIDPMPLKRGYWGRGEAKIKSEEGAIVEVFVIDPLGNRYWAERRGEDIFVIEGTIPYDAPQGSYTLYLVVRDSKGNEERKPINIEII
ncbi:hypothetical protein H5T87_10350 [bacterium]|nr:hypothetical protein [bacterium]